MTQSDDSTAGILAQFVAALEDLQANIGKANVEGRSLRAKFLATQQLYQQKLLPTLANSPKATALVTYQTEISRALRLLGIDISFLQTAKNAITIQRRQAQMQQRLKTLLDFSLGLVKALEED